MINEIYINKSSLMGRLRNAENKEVNWIDLPQGIIKIDEIEDEFLDTDIEFFYNKKHCDVVYSSELWVNIIDFEKGMAYDFEGEKFYIYHTINGIWNLNYRNLQSVSVRNHKYKEV